MTTTHRIVIGSLLAFGIACFVFLLLSYGDPGGQEDVTVSGVEEIERLIPADGAFILQQDSVGIDLAPGFEALLTVGGENIPAEQLDGIEQLNQYVFRPEQGRVFEQWPAGPVCATAQVWPTSDPGTVETVEWCFTVN